MNEEYTSSVSLMFLADNLEPEVISEELSLIPTKAWKRGEQKFTIRRDGSKRLMDSYYEWGGWRKNIDKKSKNLYLEEQLEYWCNILSSKKSNIEILKSKDIFCTLDIFITTESTASIIVSKELQKEISELGIELRISIQAHKNK